MGTIISMQPLFLMHLHSLNFRMIKLISIWQSFSSTNYQERACTKNGIYETISFGKSRKYPLRILVLKAEFYLKFQASNH
jgi:hypothetical protein